MSKLIIAGATGNVGREFIRLLDENPLPHFGTPVLLASTVSEGEEVDVNGTSVPVAFLKDFTFTDEQTVVFATPAAVTEMYAPKAQAAGAQIIDLSNTISGAKAITLGVNDRDVGEAVKTKQPIALTHAAVSQLTKLCAALKNIGAPTQVVSTVLLPTGAHGRAAMDELHAQSIALLGGQGEVYPENFPTQIAFNCLPQAGMLKQGEDSTFEAATAQAVKQVAGVDVQVVITAVTVPTFVGVSQAVHLTFGEDVKLDDVVSALGQDNSFTVLDEADKNAYSTPFGAAETDGIYVSRIRQNVQAPKGIQLWLVTDNLRHAARQIHALLQQLAA